MTHFHIKDDCWQGGLLEQPEMWGYAERGGEDEVGRDPGQVQVGMVK